MSPKRGFHVTRLVAICVARTCFDAVPCRMGDVLCKQLAGAAYNLWPSPWKDREAAKLKLLQFIPSSAKRWKTDSLSGSLWCSGSPLVLGRWPSALPSACIGRFERSGSTRPPNSGLTDGRHSGRRGCIALRCNVRGWEAMGCGDLSMAM